VFRNPIPPLLALAFLLAIALGWWLFAKTEQGRYDATLRVAHSYSSLQLGLKMVHATGPIVEEDYAMENRNGVSSSSYRAIGRGGTVIDVKALPRETYDVTFLFEQAVQDGIWELRDRPTRGDASIRYTINVSQTVTGQHGSHHFSFSDPHYWATTGGHQFKIHLDKNKPLPDLLQMSSTTLVEPRYAKLVADFTDFGTPAFRSRIAQAKARLSAAHK
jgi:hypothetical protein